ncbi:MAG: IS607 family transposase [Clostridiaceae bacterium]
MKSKEVLEFLQISRPTLTKYVKVGLVKTVTLPNGRYDYSKESVYKIFNKGVERKTCLYARVSTPKQKADLENQVSMLKQFSYSNGYCISKVFTDIASGISFDKRKDFFNMLEDVLSGKVERIIVTYKDRLSRVGFELFYHLFKKYDCEIIVMSEVGSQKLDSEEIFGEIVSLLHCYSMKLYSKRKGQKIRKILEEREVCEDDG